MKIGIIAAMEEELQLLQKYLEKAVIWNQAGCKIYSGWLHGIEVALIKSGIGKVSAALATTLLLNHFKPEVIINTGSAGGLVPSLAIGDIIVSRDVCYHDVNVTAFGYAPGQMVHCPVTFHAAPSLISLAQKIIARLGLRAMCGLVVSGDTFISNTQMLTDIQQTFPQAIAVEMEATAIAHVCYQFVIPFIVIRSISDIVDQRSHLSFQAFLSIAAKNASFLVRKMIEALATLSR